MSDDNLAIKYDEIFEDDKLGIKSLSLILPF